MGKSDAKTAKIWPIAVNARKRPRQDRRQRDSIESETKIEIQGKTEAEAWRAPRPIMADQNAKIIFIWMNFGTRGLARSPITNSIHNFRIFSHSTSLTIDLSAKPLALWVFLMIANSNLDSYLPRFANGELVNP